MTAIDCGHGCCDHPTQPRHLHTDVPTACPDCDRLARIAEGAGIVAERLAAAPATVAERTVADRSLYLSDGNGTLYLAEEVDPRHVPAPGPLYRLTPQASANGVDVLAATKASLAATRTYLDAHKESGTTQPPDRSGDAEPAPAVAALAPPAPCDDVERSF